MFLEDLRFLKLKNFVTVSGFDVPGNDQEPRNSGGLGSVHETHNPGDRQGSCGRKQLQARGHNCCGQRRSQSHIRYAGHLQGKYSRKLPLLPFRPCLFPLLGRLYPSRRMLAIRNSTDLYQGCCVPK